MLRQERRPSVIVADASAVLEVLLNTAASRAIASHLFASGQTIHVPHLMDVEVVQVLRRCARINAIGANRARQALEEYADMLVTRYPHNLWLPRMWELRHHLRAYDAMYIALAEAPGVPLLTCDRAFASFSGHRAKVLVF